MHTQASILLHRALLLDALASGATTLLLVLGAGSLAAPLGLPALLLRVVGLALVPFVGLVGWLAMRTEPPRGAVRAVVGLNVGWVVASALFLAGGWVNPTALGYAFVIGQALVVALFAQLQALGLRRVPEASSVS